MSHTTAVRAIVQGLVDLVGETVLIDSVSYAAQISELTEDEVIVAGGKPNSGGFRAKCRAIDFPIPPAQWTAIEGNGMSLKIQHNVQRTGHIEFTAVDPAAEG